MMSGIRSSNTRPEIIVRKALHRLGYRFRLNSKISKIKPDVVLRGQRIAIFVHGCYWHQHEGCKLAYSDRDYSEKWTRKFQANKERDKKVVKELIATDWRVVVIWECVTRDEKEFAEVISHLHNWIATDDSDYFESKFRKT
jgi:DNA mismatch endonuclease, patch repair protein